MVMIIKNVQEIRRIPSGFVLEENEFSRLEIRIAEVVLLKSYLRFFNLPEKLMCRFLRFLIKQQAASFVSKFRGVGRKPEEIQ